MSTPTYKGWKMIQEARKRFPDEDREPDDNECEPDDD